MRVAIPITTDGQVDHSWGRAAHVAVFDVDDGVIVHERTFAVEWDRLHDAEGEGNHHARVARFLLDNKVDGVMAGHMGQPMLQMLERMGITTVLAVSGNARDAAAGAGKPR